MQPQPLIALQDVEASSRPYPRLLDRASGHGGRLLVLASAPGDL